jgi:hypothetical protein
MKTGWVEQRFARDGGEMGDQKGQGVVHEDVPEEIDGKIKDTVAGPPSDLRQSNELLSSGRENRHLGLEARSAHMGGNVGLSRRLSRCRCSSLLKLIHG